MLHEAHSMLLMFKLITWLKKYKDIQMSSKVLHNQKKNCNT